MFAEIEASEREQRAALAPSLFDLDQLGYFTRLQKAEQWLTSYGDARSIRDAHAWTPCASQKGSTRSCSRSTAVIGTLLR